MKLKFSKRKLLLAGLFFLSAISAFAQIPSPTGFVNDFAQVMDEGSQNYLENTLSSFEQKTGDEIAVVTIPSLDGRPVEDYAVDLYKTWGIGEKGKDNGALILISPSERQMRIEVGYGLEGIINDALAGRIIREKFTPAFKDGKFSEGIVSGTTTMLAIIAKAEGINFDFGAVGQVPQYGDEPRAKKGPLHTIGSILFAIFLIYMFIRHPWLFLLFMSGMGRGSGRSGGFGGGFGGFGGGMSGGGGASGRW